MTKSQNAPRGFFKKATGEFTTLTAGTFSGTSTAFGATTATIGSIVLGVGATTVTSPAAKVITLSSTATKPAVDRGAAFALLSNSTGVAMVINSTGTTWKYLLTTAVQPT